MEAVWTWGDNGDGQLGDGANTSTNTPVRVAGVSGVTSLACGSYYTVALKNDGSVWTWGWSEALPAQGTTPVPVPGLRGWWPWPRAAPTRWL